MLSKRTDLALEAKELWSESAQEKTKLHGVVAGDKIVDGFKITTVKIENDEGASSLGKPVGKYVTFELDKLVRREENSFKAGAVALANEILEMLSLRPNDTVLVVGLGNSAITADAIGPVSANNTMVTGHLVDKVPGVFGGMRRVFVLESGVLGTTGIESAELIKAVVGRLRPDRVIVIDALASRKLSRICRTVQLADTGIIPGSGVGNARAAINRETLGVPVTAIGVPTVVDAVTLALDLAEKAGADDIRRGDFEKFGGEMIVTPKEIDSNVNDISKLIGYAINLALHRGLTVDDVTMFLS